MGLFDKIFRPDSAKESGKALRDARSVFQTLTAYRPVFTSWGGMIYESEIVRASIDARARHISKLKVETYGSAQPSLQSKLRQGPNEWQTWSQFLYRTSTILDVNNTAFIVPVFDERMVITGYYPVIPANCEVIEYKDEPWLRYRFLNGEIGAVEMKKCAILTRHQYMRDFFGDTNHALNETMKLIHIQNQGIEEAVRNTSTFRFMAQLSNFAKPEDLQKERDRFTRENLSTESEAGGFLLFPNTYKDIKQIDVKPYTVDPEQMRQIRENVFNYFGVNEKVLQSSAKADELEAFFDGSIEPFAIQFSESMSKCIFSERERAQGSGLIANANRLQYMSVSQKVQMAQQLVDRGIMSKEEAREIFNFGPPREGDTFLVRGEYINADERVTVTEEEQTDEE